MSITSLQSISLFCRGAPSRQNASWDKPLVRYMPGGASSSICSLQPPPPPRFSSHDFFSCRVQSNGLAIRKSIDSCKTCQRVKAPRSLAPTTFSTTGRGRAAQPQAHAASCTLPATYQIFSCQYIPALCLLPARRVQVGLDF